MQNQYFVHPPNPPAVVCLTILLALLSFQNAKAQAFKLPPLDSLEMSLKTYYNMQWTADRKAFNYDQKGKALNYIPSLGYGMRGPTVSYSTQQLFGYLESKKVKAASLESIDRKYELIFNEELNKLRIEYEKTALQAQKLNILEKAIITDRKIFNIYSEAYQKKELKPLEYFQKQKQFEDIQNQLNLFRQEYFIGILELKKLAHHGLKSNPLYFEPSDCEMLPAQAITVRPQSNSAERSTTPKPKTSTASLFLK